MLKPLVLLLDSLQKEYFVMKLDIDLGSLEPRLLIKTISRGLRRLVSNLEDSYQGHNLLTHPEIMIAFCDI